MLGTVPRGEFVVHERLVGPGDQGRRRTPQDEAQRESGVRRERDPGGVPEAAEQGAEDQQLAP